MSMEDRVAPQDRVVKVEGYTQRVRTLTGIAHLADKLDASRSSTRRGGRLINAAKSRVNKSSPADRTSVVDLWRSSVGPSALLGASVGSATPESDATVVATASLVQRCRALNQSPSIRRLMRSRQSPDPARPSAPDSNDVPHKDHVDPDERRRCELQNVLKQLDMRSLLLPDEVTHFDDDGANDAELGAPLATPSQPEDISNTRSATRARTFSAVPGVAGRVSLLNLLHCRNMGLRDRTGDVDSEHGWRSNPFLQPRARKVVSDYEVARSALDAVHTAEGTCAVGLVHDRLRAGRGDRASFRTLGSRLQLSLETPGEMKRLPMALEHRRLMLEAHGHPASRLRPNRLATVNDIGQHQRTVVGGLCFEYCEAMRTAV
jgi:hypothetical protein